MESQFEDHEEYTEYADDYRQRRQMRRQRQQRIRNQQRRRRLIYLGAAGVLLILLLSVLIWAIQSRDGKNSSQAQKNQAAEQKNQKQPAKQREEAEEESAAESRTPVYQFTTTPDTAVIDLAEVISTHAILINESTDTIIAAKGMDERIFPASMTKVLTVLVAAEQLEQEQLDDTFVITLDITDYAYTNECSIVGFANGEEVTVRDLFYGTILPSGGDAAAALAVYTAGSQEAFAALMNAKLEELGIADSAHFTNCVGLYDENHYCTVYDMAIIMKAALQNELCREILSAHTYTTSPTAQHPQGITISNWFLRRIEDKDTRGIVQCAKTGYIAQSQNCAVSYGTFADQTPYICVTTGSTSSWRCIYDHVEIYTRYISAQ
ncbi:MAG: D-alanyl-D-alanine carboxypeptidase [Lachnospiraceae bacterium]|nr:D-alanyl-D-alanine carboxypeptidase [Lachnospiraceae bacterium]